MPLNLRTDWSKIQITWLKTCKKNNRFLAITIYCKRRRNVFPLFPTVFRIELAYDLWLMQPCGRLSWLPVSFLLHVKYTLSYCISLKVHVRWTRMLSVKGDAWPGGVIQSEVDLSTMSVPCMGFRQNAWVMWDLSSFENGTPLNSLFCIFWCVSYIHRPWNRK